MKVEVIKGVSHSIELIHGETSVCITPDEAESLIAQLRAVVPVQDDIQEAAFLAYPVKEKLNYKGTGKYDKNFQRRRSFAAGMLAERERLMKEAVGCMFSFTEDKTPCLLIGDGYALRVNAKKGDYFEAIIIKKEK